MKQILTKLLSILVLCSVTFVTTAQNPADTTRAAQLLAEAVDLKEKGRIKLAFEKAVEAKELFKATVGVQHLNFIKTDIQIASLLFEQNFTDSAARMFKYYLPIVEKLPNNDLLLCVVLRNLAVTEALKNNYKITFDLNKRAFECDIERRNKPSNVLRGYNAMGLSFKTLEQYDSAMVYYNHGMTYAKEQKLTETLAFLYLISNRAGLYGYLNDNNKSIEEYLVAIELAERLQHEDYQLWGNLYYNLSLLYRKINKYDLALNALRKSFEKFSKLANPEPLIVDHYHTLANIFKKLSQKDSAVVYFEKAIALQKATGGENFRLGRIIGSFGNFYSDFRELDRADSLYLYADELYKKTFKEKNRDVGVNYYNYAYNQIRRKDYPKAIVWLKKTLFSLNYTEGGYFGSTGDPNVVSMTLLELALCQYQLYLEKRTSNELVEARHYAQLYLELMRYFENQMTYDQSKTNLLSAAYPAYEIAIATHSDETQAFALAEQSKALRLYEMVRTQTALTKVEAPDSVMRQLKTFQNVINELEKKRQLVLDGGKTALDSAYLNLSRGLHIEREREIAYKTTIEKSHPSFYRAKLNRSFVDLKEVQTKLLKPNQTLVQYVVGDTTLIVFVVKKEFFERKIYPKDFPLADWVKTLRTAMTDSLATQAHVFTDFAYKLYEKLVQPIKTHLTEDVIFIPDGVLGYLPFEVLLTSRPEKAIRFQTHQYLLRNHNISYCFSATLLREMQQKQHITKPDYNVLAFAPFYYGDTSIVSKIIESDTSMRRAFYPLSSSGEEVVSIAKLMDGKILLGKTATDSIFKQTASTAKILHLATHAKADDKQTEKGYLAFAPSKDSFYLPLIYTRDLYGLTINADMVVLSACETGVGILQRGEGIISLARAFAYSGAKSIVTSLWAVNDVKTKDLMLSFYKNLRKGKAKDAALRAAKLSLIEQNDHPNAHPFYWAGFVGIGDMQPLR